MYTILDKDLNVVAKEEHYFQRKYITPILLGMGIFFVLTLFIVSLITTQRTKNELILARETNINLIDSLDNLIRFEKSEHLNYLIGYYLINESQDSISDKNILILLERVGAWYPDIILAQAKLESANYTSQIYRTNNNPFGMKCVYKRPTTQISPKSSNVNTNYGYYRNWECAVLDRVLWDLYKYPNKPSLNEYKQSIAAIYAEDDSYITKLENLLK